ncbi:WD40 repeat domain-containing protein [Dactylosporangium siamense]|uniref:WD40 repeat domain-containing protein n=1 Tax=Dactylosporangium siamense TaxID=685454 RepID=UPI001943AC72|nr:WD40 repeat domain-containing protein [Dactylosporangium siamense]
MYVSELAWSPDGYVYFKRDVDDGPGQVWRMRPGGRAEAFLDAKALADPCEGSPAYVSVVRAVGDTALAVGFECLTSQDRLYVVDLRTRVMTPLLTGDDIRDVALDASGARGYVAQQRGNCASVARFGGGALHGLDVRVPALTGEWRLLEGYDASAREHDGLTCGAAGKAVSPASTSDGRTVVMVVTTAPHGSGFQSSSMADRYDWQAGILDGDAVRLVGPTLSGVLRLAVAPDGARVALVRNGEDDGMQVFGLPDGEARAVATKGRVSDPAFSPDGKTIAYCSDETTIRFAAVS